MANSTTGTTRSGATRGISRLARKHLNLLLIAVVVLLAIITVVVVFIGVQYSHNDSQDTGEINAQDIQAVAVNVSLGGTGGDQLYFGNIKSINNNFVTIDNVYYIPSTVTQNDIKLEPLSCEADMPTDQMVVNRMNVTWWENLQPNGKIAKSIEAYEKQHSGNSCPAS